MKYLSNIYLGVLAIFLVSSCTDESLLNYEVSKPESIQNYEYLKNYDLLKSYVNRSVDPNFILGAAVSLNDFNDKGYKYSHIVSNFDEITAGYRMKHGALVEDNGNIKLSGVEKFVETAKEGGVSIYGHTLCWHSNQNATYLNSIIAPIIIPGTGGVEWEPLAVQDFEADDASNYEYSSNAIVSFTADGEGANGEGRAISVKNEAVQANDYSTQFFVSFDDNIVEGETYVLTMDVKAEADVSFATQAHVVPYQYKHWSFFGSINASTEWTTFSKELVATSSHDGTGALALNLGNNATTYYFDNISVVKHNPDAAPRWDLVSGNDFESDDASNYEGSDSAILDFSADGEGADASGRALVVANEEVRDNDWGCQLFFTFDPAAEVGERYTLSMDVRSDVDASYSTQAHTAPGAYKHWSFFGTVNSTTEWTKFEKEITITDNTATATTIAFNLGKTATNFYFDNIQLTKYTEGGSADQIIEKTPEEKRDTISYALDNWISGMLNVTKDYVKAWDVVNEPMDDGSPYELKTGIGKSDLADDHFYWQDYLGKDYAVMAFNLARQYGNSDDIHFINDYNLEYNIDKCKGLIAYVEYIEEQGAQVDGIGTQMHISIESDKDKIVQMFELLAATGKLIKISELDIGLGSGADGAKKTGEATEEDYIAQAGMYQFVIEKYFEIIPSNQRYGITVWSPTDKGDDANWRKGEPVGLWTKDYSRKHAYGAFADGLGGE